MRHLKEIGSVILETMNFIGIVKFDAQLSSHVTHFCLFIWSILIPCLILILVLVYGVLYNGFIFHQSSLSGE